MLGSFLPSLGQIALPSLLGVVRSRRRYPITKMTSAPFTTSWNCIDSNETRGTAITHRDQRGTILGQPATLAMIRSREKIRAPARAAIGSFCRSSTPTNEYVRVPFH